MAVRKKLGDVLIDAGVLTQAQLQAALDQQARSGGRLGRILIDHGLVDERRLTRALSEQLNVPMVELDSHKIHDVVRDEVPKEMAEKLNLFPVGIRREETGATLYVAMSDPTNVDAIDSLQFRSGKKVSPMIAGEQEIDRAIRRAYYGEAVRSTTPPPMESVQFSGNDIELDAGPEEIPVVTGTVLDHGAPQPMFGPVGGFLGAAEGDAAPQARAAPVQDLEPIAEHEGPSDQTQPYALNPYATLDPFSARAPTTPPSGSVPPVTTTAAANPASAAPVSPAAAPPVQDHPTPSSDSLNPFASPPPTGPGGSKALPENSPSDAPPEVANEPLSAAVDVNPAAHQALPIEQVELHAPASAPPTAASSAWADAIGDDDFQLSGPSPIAPPKDAGLPEPDPFGVAAPISAESPIDTQTPAPLPTSTNTSCDNCGNEIIAVARFCPNCGQQRLPVPGSKMPTSGETLDLTEALELTEVPAVPVIAPAVLQPSVPKPATIETPPSTTAPMFTAVDVAAPEPAPPESPTAPAFAPPMASEAAQVQASFAPKMPDSALAPSKPDHALAPPSSPALDAAPPPVVATVGPPPAQSVLAPPAGVVELPPADIEPTSAPEVASTAVPEPTTLADDEIETIDAEEIVALPDVSAVPLISPPLPSAPAPSAIPTASVAATFATDLPPTAIEPAAGVTAKETSSEAPVRTEPLEDMSDVSVELRPSSVARSDDDSAPVPEGERTSAFETIHAPSFANPRDMVPVEEWGTSAGDIGPDGNENAAPFTPAVVANSVAAPASAPSVPAPPALTSPLVAPPPPPPIPLAPAAMSAIVPPPPPPPSEFSSTTAPVALAPTPKKALDLSSFPDPDDARLVDDFASIGAPPTSLAAHADDVDTWNNGAFPPIRIPFSFPTLASAAAVDDASRFNDAAAPAWHDVDPAIINAIASDAAFVDDPSRWGQTANAVGDVMPLGAPPPPPPPPGLADTWKDAAEKPLYAKRVDAEEAIPGRRKMFEVSESMPAAPSAPAVEPKVSYTPLSTPAAPNLPLPATGAAPWAAVPAVAEPTPVAPEPPAMPQTFEAMVPEPSPLDPPAPKLPAPQAPTVPPPAAPSSDDEGMDLLSEAAELPPPEIGGEDMMPSPFSMPMTPVPGMNDAAPELPEEPSNPFKGPSPTMITKMNPAELRKLAERLVQKGALTDDDYQAAKNDGSDEK